MLFDSASLTLPFICFGLYSSLPLQAVQIISSQPFLLMIFFSTTFSPGAGVEGIKALRYLFTRFYFWCALPLDPSYVEGCPADDTLIGYALLTGCAGMLLFVAYQLIAAVVGNRKKAVEKGKRATAAASAEFQQLQRELYKDPHSSFRVTDVEARATSARELEVVAVADMA